LSHIVVPPFATRAIEVGHWHNEQCDLLATSERTFRAPGQELVNECNASSGGFGLITVLTADDRQTA
jgi:hypothetical protein